MRVGVEWGRGTSPKRSSRCLLTTYYLPLTTYYLLLTTYYLPEAQQPLLTYYLLLTTYY